jgi:hypothetical protein
MTLTHIEIEECLGQLRKEITGNTNDLDEVRIAICKAQNLLQRWIEHHCNRAEWKHVKTDVTPKLYNGFVKTAVTPRLYTNE